MKLRSSGKTHSPGSRRDLHTTEIPLKADRVSTIIIPVFYGIPGPRAKRENRESKGFWGKVRYRDAPVMWSVADYQTNIGGKLIERMLHCSNFCTK